ncbi:hypothetical protein B2A_11024 [mine drainage metagenome]|uniref:Uncharacterized protein n=1 Tax=mine drainage metagenome TaxID=410659 RepID=T1AEU3_9ZZZZ
MHGIIKEWKSGDFEFVWGFDTGGSVGGTNALDVSHQGAFLFERVFYFHEDNEEHVKNFAKKVVRDSEYLQRIIRNEAQWQKIEKIYEPLEIALYETWSTIPDFLGYVATDKVAERRSRELHDAFYLLCERLYGYISKNIDELIVGWGKDERLTTRSLIEQIQNGKI